MMKNREAVTTNGRAVFYAAMWNDFRQTAMDHGWALALHGSLANDMDIMAMPWVENHSAPIEMVYALKKCFQDPDNDIQITESEMPNHRRVFTLSIWSDFYLDINVIAPSKADNLPISGVSDRRELLLDFMTWYCGDEHNQLPDDAKEIVEIYCKQ